MVRIWSVVLQPPKGGEKFKIQKLVISDWGMGNRILGSGFMVFSKYNLKPACGRQAYNIQLRTDNIQPTTETLNLEL